MPFPNLTVREKTLKLERISAYDKPLPIDELIERPGLETLN